MRWWKTTGCDQLRQLFYWRWDPIGVNRHFPSTLGEYDSYVDQMVGDTVGAALEQRVLEAALKAQQAMGQEAKPGAEFERRHFAGLVLEWRNQSIWMWKEFRR